MRGKTDKEGNLISKAKLFSLSYASINLSSLIFCKQIMIVLQPGMGGNVGSMVAKEKKSVMKYVLLTFIFIPNPLKVGINSNSWKIPVIVSGYEW